MEIFIPTQCARLMDYFFGVSEDCTVLNVNQLFMGFVHSELLHALCLKPKCAVCGKTVMFSTISTKQHKIKQVVQLS